MEQQIELQPGILRDGILVAHFSEWRLTASPLRALALLENFAPHEDHVIGLGYDFVKAFGANIPDFFALKPRVGLHSMPVTPLDLFCYVQADDLSQLNDKLNTLLAYFGQAFQLVQSALCFRYQDGRELSGHLDGTANETGDAALAAVAIPEGPFACASFAFVQRYVYLEGALRTMDVTARNQAFGRDVADNHEMENALPSAHVKRTDQDVEGLGGHIIRRSMPFIASNRRGTEFIAFTNHLSHIDLKLDHMFGLKDGITDAILQFAQAETGAYYFCPRLRNKKLDVAFLSWAITKQGNTKQGITDMTHEKQVPPQPQAGQEWVAGDEVDIIFNAERCIHSRHCVLDRPDVFVPNVAGAWIHPEKAKGEEIAALARNCPSGAIRFHSHSDVAPEQPPLVNVVWVRENGPYAVHANFEIQGFEPEFRATLCRCGQSLNKPYCDNSHVAKHFKATGEPLATPAGAALTQRDGPLKITPTADGPLVLAGPVEIIAGTGHRIAQTQSAALCRCGHSHNKPFCDGSHAAAGFHAS